MEQPPTGRLVPALMAEHIEAAARPLLPGTGTDLVVGADIAAWAAAELAADGTAAHALLIEADSAALVGRPGFQPPAPGEETKELLRAMAPWLPTRGGCAHTGRGPKRGVAAMTDQSLGGCTALGEEDRELLRGITTARLTEAMPLDVSGALDSLDGTDQGPN